MGVSWTEEQKKVIDTRNCNILVSAAAGSGKTAVLVERILQLITDPLRPLDIDRLLIVTFTRAAAGEMKERIRAAIEKKLEQDEGNEHLQKQSVLIHHAQITTIDSFCSYIVKNYFHLIDLDPSFRMGDEGEMRLLKADVVDQVMEESYAAQENEEFTALVDGFSNGKTDARIPELILKLYEFAMSYPYPEEWLLSCKKAYELETVEELEQTSWMRGILKEIQRELQEAEKLLRQGIEICSQEDGPGFYLELYEQEHAGILQVLKARDFRTLKNRIESIEFKRLPPGKKAEKELVSEQKQDLAKQLRNEAKDMIKKVREDFFSENLEEILESLCRAKKPVSTLVNLTLRFLELYGEKKREKNILDFADLEHYALKILVEHTEQGDKRTDAARELAEQFSEIMIDEYQDSNLVQEKLLTSVSRIEDGIYNIFMVGDVKQSIYRFRLARPDLFMEKFHTYPVEAGQEKLRIDLHKNFRSRAEVLESVNYLFYQLMGEDLGGVEYDRDAALYPEGKFPPRKEEDPATELLLFETDSAVLEDPETMESDRESEARMAALRIRELMRNQLVYDKNTEEYRPARYSDFTILLRTMTGWAETFKRILNSCGIPASVTTKTGYFSAPEVVTVLDYLQILDNPYQDIPLAGAMKGMPDGFHFQELAEIRILGKKAEKTSFFEAVLLAEQEDSMLGAKVRSFLKIYRKLREKVPYTPMHELLWELFDETGFFTYQQAFVSGEQKKANLLMLIEKAQAYESSSYKGLFHFIRYIENLKKYQVDFGEANILSDQEDTVRIMSIHGSKGLEFPIVFVAGMGKQINLQDTRESMVLHPDLGIGAPCMDEKHRIRSKTILQRAVQQALVLESLGEELRILYVALTRAKEKLILTSAISKMQDRLQECSRLQRQAEQMLPYKIRKKAKSYLDLIFSALARHKAMTPLYQEHGIEAYPFQPWYEGPGEFLIRIVSPFELVEEATKVQMEGLQEKGELLLWDKDKVYDSKVREALEQSYGYSYPYENQKNIPSKLAVSELKSMQEPREEDSIYLYAVSDTEEEHYIPAFMRKETVEPKGAERGTIYHRIFEFFDYHQAETPEEISRQLDKMVEEGRLTGTMREAVKERDFLTFSKSALGQRMRRSYEQGTLYREQPFVLAVPANQVKQEYDSKEEILIQGIIDAYFEEEGELVLVDYKTDRVWNRKPETLVERYQVQLQSYKKALEQLTGKKVKAVYIYSVYLGKEILLEG